MRLITRAILFALALAWAPFAAAGSFGGEKIVSSDINIGSQFPEVAYYNGVIHVVWVGYAPGLSGDIYYSRSTSSTGSFSTPVNLSANATGSAGNDRPQVTAGPNGVYVGWNSHNDTGAIYVRRSTDAGVSFGTAQLIAGAESDGKYSRITDLFTDSSGRVHLAYYTDADNGGSSVGMVHHRATCDGSTWGTDTAVTNRTIDGDVDNEQPRLGEAGGRIYVAFRSSRYGNPQGGWAPYSIQLQSGTVNGACSVAWSYPARRIAGGVPYSLSSAYRPDVFGDSTGTLHLSWWDNTRGANAAYRKGVPATGLFGAASTLSSFGADHLEPGGLGSTTATAAGGFQVPVAIVSNGTTAFMAYQRNSELSASVTGFEMGPIYLRESSNNGTSWGAEQSIAADTKATTPRLAIDNSNTQNVAIVWSDVRGGTARVYYRLYTLGAVSGGPSFSLSPSPHNFGNVAVGSSSANQAFTLLNSGTAGSVSGVALSGDFSIVSNTCSGTVGAGGSCTITARFNPTALGTRNGTITVSTDATDSPTTASLTGSGVASGSFSANVNAVVTGFYETILGRSPDAGGLAFWGNEATRVQGVGADVKEVFYAMSVQFFNSSEYLSRNTSDTQYLTDLYRTFFIREPDSAGMAFWQSQLSGGMDRGAMLNNFLFSTEFSNFMTGLFGTANPRPEVNLTIDLYRGILGVLPDSGGFNFWLGQVRTAQCQGSAAVVTAVGDLATLFVGSAEYQQRENARPAGERTKRHVGDLYNAFLRRGGDLDGYNFWVSQIASGSQTRDQVRAAFLQSPEFQARVNAVIAAGCAT